MPDTIAAVHLAGMEHQPLSVRFENVSFSYPGRADVPVFNELNFEIPRGKVVAFVGESGAGGLILYCRPMLSYFSS